jgi:hypothetical protein
MSSSPEERIPEDDDTAEAPLTMAASVVLTNLPKDASKALEMAGTLGVEKGGYNIFAHVPSTSSPLSLLFTSPIPLNSRFFLIGITMMKSQNPPPSHILRPTAKNPRLLRLHRPPLRSHHRVHTQEAGCEAARERVLLCRQCFCAGVGRGGGQFVEGEFLIS